MKKALTLSIIIPVYNEAHRLKYCLDAIAAQNEMPDEVIVVDNNSTDESVTIAQSYSFVKVVREKQQGLIFARDHGFRIAKSDILGRIDADSMINPNWTIAVKELFADNTISAATGPSYSLLLPRIKWPLTSIWSRLYFVWSHVFYGVPLLWGANMAVRATDWKTIQKEVCKDAKVVHEDQDISLLLRSHGKKLVNSKTMFFTSYSQAQHYFPKLMYYSRLRNKTRAYHRQRGSFKTIQLDYYGLKRFLLFAIGWPIIALFYVASFLMWPLDAFVTALGKQDSWLS
jgi:glycosyltransferase involved in cell wall biosynthesis